MDDRRMRAKQTYESIRFKRGLDPKKAMKIGIQPTFDNTLIIKYAQKAKEYHEKVDPKVLHKILENPRKWIDENEDPTRKSEPMLRLYTDYSNQWSLPYLMRDFVHDPAQGMVRCPYDFIEYEGEYYMLNPQVNESVNFERGKDPKEAMGIGAIANTPVIKDMDIEMSDRGIVQSYDDYIAVQENTWGEGVNDPDLITNVLENWEEESIYAYSFWVDDPTEPDEDWEYLHAPEMEGESFVWQGRLYHIPKTGKFKDMNESVRFERGQDPKDSLGIGDKLFRHNRNKLIDIQTEFPFMKGEPGELAGEITTLGIRLIGLKERKSTGSYFLSYKNPKGGLQGKIVLTHRKSLPEDVLLYVVEWFDAKYRLWMDDELQESVRFERGQDPKRAMGIGISLFTDISRGSILRVDKDIPNLEKYKGDLLFVYSVYGSDNSKTIMYTYENDPGGTHKWSMSKDFFEKHLTIIDQTNESVNFERGREPKSSMGIGVFTDIKNRVHEFLLVDQKQWTLVSSIHFNNDGDRVNIETDENDLENDANQKYIQSLLKTSGLDEYVSDYIISDADQRNNILIDWDAEVLQPYVGKMKATIFYLDDKSGLVSKGWGAKNTGVEVKESVNFERGKDPRSAMQVGIMSNIEEDIEKYDAIQLGVQRNPHLKYQNLFGREMNALVPSRMEGRHGWGNFHLSFNQLTPEEYSPIKDVINKYYRVMFESVNFKRGQSPKGSMGIGIFEPLVKDIEEFLQDILSSYKITVDNFPSNDLDDEPHKMIATIDPRKKDGSPIKLDDQSTIRDMISSFTWSISERMMDKGFYHIGSKVNMKGDLKGRPLRIVKTPYITITYDEHSEMPTNESVRFERGGDPKKSMGIGRATILEKIDNWVHPPTSTRRYYNAVKDGDYKGHTIVIYKSVDADPTHYIPVILYPNGTITDGAFHDSADLAWTDAIKMADMEIFRQETGYYDNLGESVSFERGLGPKEAMDIGEIHDAEKIAFFEKDLNKLGGESGGYITVQADDLRLMLMYWSQVSEEEKKYTFVFSDKYSGDSIEVLDNKWVEYYGKRYFLSMDKEGRKDIRESVSFERGQKPTDAMSIGAKATIPVEQTLRGMQRGFTLDEIKPIMDLLELPTKEIYLIAFGGEVDYDQWHFNEYGHSVTLLVDDHPVKKEMKSELPNRSRNWYRLVDTEIGPMVKAKFDEEGLYYFGTIEAAIKMDIVKNKDQIESIF